MSKPRGVVYIAFGDKAERSAIASIASLREHYTGPIEIWSDRIIAGGQAYSRYVSVHFDNISASRFCKINLLAVSPFDCTLYLDADTLVRGSIDAGFDILEDGYDIAICPSTNQGIEAMHHVSDDERQYTLFMLGCALQLQAGVMFIRKSPEVIDLFCAWRDEWCIWHNQDQAALMRALDQHPVKVWLLGRPWNGGVIIEHRFGRAR